MVQNVEEDQKEHSAKAKERRNFRKGVISQIKEDQHDLWVWKLIGFFFFFKSRAVA